MNEPMSWRAQGWKRAGHRDGFDWWENENYYARGEPYVIALPRGLEEAIEHQLRVERDPSRVTEETVEEGQG